MAAVAYRHESRGLSAPGHGGGSGLLASRFPGAQYAERKPTSVLIRFYSGGKLQHRIPHRRQAITAIRRCEQFRLNHACAVGQSQEFHRLAGDLMVNALLDHQTARRIRGYGSREFPVCYRISKT